MNISTLIVTFILVLILYAVGKRAYKFYVFYKRLNKIPGPNYRIPLFGFILKMMALEKGDHLRWFSDICDQYKDGLTRVWIGTMGLVSLRKPEHIEVLLRNYPLMAKAHIYELMWPWLGQGLLTATGTQWLQSRKRLNPAFHVSLLEEFSEVMIDKATIFNKCIEREITIHGDKPFDIFQLSANCALDILCETAMGVDVKAQEGIASEFIKAIHTLSSTVVYRGMRPWLDPDWIFYRFPVGRAFRNAIQISHGLCSKVIKRKQQELESGSTRNSRTKETGTTDELGKRKRKAFLDLLLEANENSENPMSTKELQDECNTFLFAGHDTTASLVSFALFALGVELDIQRRVHEELDEVLGDADNQTTLTLLPNLKCLERVIKETLRVYPSAPAISRYLTDDIEIGDHIVPKGTTVDVNIYQLHRNRSIWSDPLRFDPDRFLPENSKGRHPLAYAPFSSGPRNCIGQKFALLEAKIILTQVLRKFSVKSVDSHSTIKMEMEIVLRPSDGIYVHMMKRSKDNAK